METVTLNLTPWQYYRLRDGLDAELKRWKLVKTEAEQGLRPNASVEGAQILIDDCTSVLDQLKAWASDKENFVN